MTAEGGALQGMVEELQKSLLTGDSSVFDAAVNGEWMLERATDMRGAAGLAVTDELEEAFQDGTRNSWKNRSLASDYLNQDFRFVRVHQINGRAGLLFRATGEHGALNYCLLTFAQEQEGHPAVDDIFVVGLNEFVTDTLRRGFLTLAQSLNPVGEAGRRAALYVEHLPVIIEANKALAARDYSKVMALTGRLPVDIRRERTVMLLRLEAAEHISLTEREAVFGEWSAMHPDEMSLPLKYADHHAASGRYEQAEAILWRLDERIGGDSYVKLRIGQNRVLQRRAAKLALSAPGDAPTTPTAAVPAVEPVSVRK